jgi:membrane-bound serine protease (ClpP class)
MWQLRGSVLILALAALLGARSSQARAAGPSTVLWLEVSGTIDPAVDDFLAEAFEKAEARAVEAVVIQLDTPGGLVTTTRDIVARELNAPLPIIVWVGPAGARAASAGVFVTLAAHVAAMAPGTHIGAFQWPGSLLITSSHHHCRPRRTGCATGRIRGIAGSASAGLCR